MTGVFFFFFRVNSFNAGLAFALNALARHASLEEQVASAAYGKAYSPLGSGRGPRRVIVG